MKSVVQWQHQQQNLGEQNLGDQNPQKDISFDHFLQEYCRFFLVALKFWGGKTKFWGDKCPLPTPGTTTADCC